MCEAKANLKFPHVIRHWHCKNTPPFTKEYIDPQWSKNIASYESYVLHTIFQHIFLCLTSNWNIKFCFMCLLHFFTCFAYHFGKSMWKTYLKLKRVLNNSFYGLDKNGKWSVLRSRKVHDKCFLTWKNFVWKRFWWSRDIWFQFCNPHVRQMKAFVRLVLIKFFTSCTI